MFLHYSAKERQASLKEIKKVLSKKYIPDFMDGRFVSPRELCDTLWPESLY